MTHRLVAALGPTNYGNGIVNNGASFAAVPVANDDDDSSTPESTADWFAKASKTANWGSPSSTGSKGALLGATNYGDGIVNTGASFAVPIASANDNSTPMGADPATYTPKHLMGADPATYTPKHLMGADPATYTPENLMGADPATYSPSTGMVGTSSDTYTPKTAEEPAAIGSDPNTWSPPTK